MKIGASFFVEKIIFFGIKQLWFIYGLKRIQKN